MSEFLPLDIARCDAGTYEVWEGAMVDGHPARLVPFTRDAGTLEHRWVPAGLFGPQGDRRPVLYDAAVAYVWAPEFTAYRPWMSTTAAKTTTAVGTFLLDGIVFYVWLIGVAGATVGGGFIGALFGYLADGKTDNWDGTPRFNDPVVVVTWFTTAVVCLCLTRRLARAVKGR